MVKNGSSINIYIDGPFQSWDLMWSNVERGLSELTQLCRVENLGGEVRNYQKVCVDDCT